MVEFNFETLSQRFRELAFLNAGLKITITDERSGKSHEFKFDGGIVSFVEHLNKAKQALHDKPIHFVTKKELVELEIAMQWNDGYDERTYTFANNINTPDGGTHLSGFKAALTRTINSYAEKSQAWKDLKEAPTGDDAREGLAAVISVKLPQPQFEGQTKNRLVTPEVKGLVEQMVNDQLEHLPRGEPADREADRREDRRRLPRADRRPQGARDGAAQGRARRRVAPGQARRLPVARPGRERAVHRRG